MNTVHRCLRMDELLEVTSSIQRSGIPKTSSSVQRIAHNNNKVNSQLLGTSTTQEYFTEQGKGKCGHQTNSTYSGSVGGRLTSIFKSQTLDADLQSGMFFTVRTNFRPKMNHLLRLILSFTVSLTSDIYKMPLKGCSHP